MFTEDQGTGLFSSFKSLFGSSKKSEATTGNIEELVEEYTRPSMEGIEVPATPMHTRTVFFEAKAGPYVPLNATEKADWAPLEGAPDAAAYLDRLLQNFSALAD